LAFHTASAWTGDCRGYATCEIGGPSDYSRELTRLGAHAARQPAVGRDRSISGEGIDNVKLGAWLLNQHRIVNTPIVHPEFRIRITPTSTRPSEEIDIFADKVLEAAQKGIAACILTLIVS